MRHCPLAPLPRSAAEEALCALYPLCPMRAETTRTPTRKLAPPPHHHPTSDPTSDPTSEPTLPQLRVARACREAARRGGSRRGGGAGTARYRAGAQRARGRAAQRRRRGGERQPRPGRAIPAHPPSTSPAPVAPPVPPPRPPSLAPLPSPPARRSPTSTTTTLLTWQARLALETHSSELGRARDAVTRLERALAEAQHKLSSHELLATQAAEARQLLVSTRNQRGEAVQLLVADAEGSRQQTLRRLVTLEQERALSEARARVAAEASAAAERAQLASTAAQDEARRLQVAAEQAAQAAREAAQQASSGAAGDSLRLLDGGGPSALPAANGFGLEGCGVGASATPVRLCFLHTLHPLCTLAASSLHPLHRLCSPVHSPRTRPLHPLHAPHAPPLQAYADTFGSINAGESLQSLLARLGLEKLLPIFMQNDVTQVAELRLLTDADFKEMSILIGSRRKILDALGTGGGVGLGQGGIGGGRGVAPASTSDSFLAGLASPPAAMAATTLAAIGSSPQMDGAAGGGGGGSCDMFGALSMVGCGAVAPTQAVDIFGALSMAAGADAADVPPTPPSSASAFGFLGGGGEVNGQSSTAAAAWPSGVRMLDPGAFTDSDKLMTSVPAPSPPSVPRSCNPTTPQSNPSPTRRPHESWPSPSLAPAPSPSPSLNQVPDGAVAEMVAQLPGDPVPVAAPAPAPIGERPLSPRAMAAGSSAFSFLG